MDEDESTSRVASQTHVSQYLITCFQNLIKTDSMSKIERGLKMISTNLTYDDPGMFNKSMIIRDEQDRFVQDATVMWLVNQVIWVSNEKKFYRSMEILTDLQKTIISASFMKQPALCGILIEKYCELTNLLSNAVIRPTKPLVIDLFQVKDFNLTTIVPNCSYQSIEISEKQSLDNILLANVRLLTHAAVEIAGLENQLLNKCTKSIMNAFKNANLCIKTKCLGYFTKIFTNLLCLDVELQPMIISILECIEEIEGCITLWTHHKLIKAEEITKYIGAVVDLLKSPHITNLFEIKFLRQASIISLQILSTHQKLNVPAYDKIIKSIRKFLKKTQAEVDDETLHRNIFSFVQNSGSDSSEFERNVELLGSVVLRQMKQLDMSAWRLVDEKLGDIVSAEDVNSNTIVDQLNCVRAIFTTARLIEHNLAIHWQREMCSDINPNAENIEFLLDLRKVYVNNVNKCDRRLFPNLDALSTYMLKQFSSLLTTSYSPLVDTSTLLLLSEIAIGILSVSDVRDIDDYLQLKLLLFALCPFVRCSELLFNHFQQAFEEASSRMYKIMESPFVRNSSNNSLSWQHDSLKLIASINLEFVSCKNKDIFMDFVGQIITSLQEPENLKQIMEALVSYIVQMNTYSVYDYEKFLKKAIGDQRNHLVISSHLRELFCLASGDSFVFQSNKNDLYCYKIMCGRCHLNKNNKTNEKDKFLNLLDRTSGKYVRTLKTKYELYDNCYMECFKFLSSEDHQIRTNMTRCIPSILSHLDLIRFVANTDLWLNPIVDNVLEVRLDMAKNMSIFPKISDENVVNKCLEKLLQCTKKFLLKGQKLDQSSVLQLILSFSTSDEITEPLLLYCFRLTLYFCISAKSLVSQHGVLCATEMCFHFSITPKNLLIWYKTNLFKLIVPLCVSNYLTYDIDLEKSLQAIGQLFGYDETKPNDFIIDHFDIILAMLIPWSIKHEKCVGLIEEICDIVQKDLSTTIFNSFLSIYTYLYLNETPEIIDKCTEIITQTTGNSVYQLLKSDVKRTIGEVLLYYHLNPKFVMSAFRDLLSDGLETENSQTTFTTTKLSEYIKTRFLGVICHFEQILIKDNEKFLKREVLLSIGGIMRFMGSTYITPFRFKLLAVLRTALTIKQTDLKDVCAKVWKIFILTVDVLELGPLLSTIFVSLEPLLETHPDVVNEMLKYLIIENGNLLSTYISDLFFLQNTRASDEIKKYVSKYTERASDSFMQKFSASMRYINHDNLTVRIYGLNHLTQLFENNRETLNQLIIGQQQMHLIIENLLDNLMVGIKNHDEMLQIAAGRCLGKLGAIEPSHLSPNYGPQQSFARSINTDEFAIMALAELCKAYQSQKNTKNVDGYSLAIQEILLDRQVCPQENRNLKVWEAIPDRMRPLMEPLLTSCYTAMAQSLTKIKIHPIFDSFKCNTHEEWAKTWALKMIEVIGDDSITNLLRSFKPSMRCDTRVLTMVLPYIIIHAIQLSEENDRKEIAEEIYTVAASVINPLNKWDDDMNKQRHRTIRSIDFCVTTNESDSVAEVETIDIIGIKCAKFVFNQLDFIDRWIRSSKPTDENYTAVKNFINQFDKKLIARANFACGEYARALIYLETYIEGNREERLQAELSFLFQIYAELMDPDSLEGALNMKDTEPTLTEQILKNNVQGRWQESAVCFERLMHVNGLTESNSKDMIQCYLGLDQPETAILLAEGLMKHLYDQNTDVLMQSCAEPLWRLGRFEDLDELIVNSNSKESTEWGIRCGQILLDFRKDDSKLFALEVDKSRLAILKNLRIVGDEQNCYHKGYSNVMKLHLISEIEQAHCLVNKFLDANFGINDGPKLLAKLLNDWDSRLLLLQPAAKVIEPVLCLRRIVLNEVKNMLRNRLENKNSFTCLEKQINSYIGASWIKSIELAKDAGMHQQADLYILNAETYKPINLFIEKAKLLWKKGDQTNSFKVLERGIEELMPSNSDKKLNGIERATHAEAKFLIANYNAESLNINTDLNVKYFKSAIAALPESEKSLVHYAQYLDKTLAALPAATSTDPYNAKTYDYQLEIMYIYCKSMLYGSKYIYQSMPRVLSIWFDFTACLADPFVNKKQEEHFRRIANNMNRVAERFSEKLPPFIFFTAFSQLVSRICHPSNEVYAVLQTIIVKLILAFPQQSLWMILSVYKSSYASRVRRCTQVLSDKRLQAKEMQKLIQDFNGLAEKLIELTNKELPSKQLKFSINAIYPLLPAIFKKSGLSPILMPIEKYMQPVLPALHQRDEPANSFDAFPNQSVYIVGIKDELSVLPSLQRPKRVTLVGSDGNSYIIMMKPKDDLRKDFRLMEFNSVVKQYLHQNSEARQRRLNIRTYAVLPLNEECGILEWVPNLQAFRLIVNGYYKQRSIGATSKEVKEGQAVARESIEKKRDWFKRILAKSPPVFSDWFRERFTTPHNWYQARSSYIRTTAVMSIVGYILGLGDRHGENILFDAGNGDAVHVDFNCLFNKGELFEIPEVVPFRLTHNMVHAMGPLGVEGLFRKCCEITLKVLQDQMPTLMSVLRPFVYDPLVSWSRHLKNDGRSERTDSQAMMNVRQIEERLKGYVKIKGLYSNMPLSTEGVVNHCILEATDIDKLASMYIGWGAYL